MTDWEIAKSYKHAISKTKQIQILAQLNACDVLSVIQALNRQGIRLDKKRPPKPRVVKGIGRPQCDKEVGKRKQEFRDALMAIYSTRKQSELARQTGVPEMLLSYYARGLKYPSTRTFEKILRGLEITREEFFRLGQEVRR